MKKNKTLRPNKLLILFIAIFLLSISVFLPAEKPVKAIAAGCISGRPTAITGTVKGYLGDYDNYSVNVQVGFDLLDAYNHKIDIYGNRIGAGYSYSDHVNPDLVPPGSATVLDQTFGRKVEKGNGPLCVSSKVKSVWFELYPKDDNGVTDKTHYGGANDQKMPVKSSVTNSFTLRLPTSGDYGGNTGDVNGYASYNGVAINPSNLKFTAFPIVSGTSCGVQGFSAAADTETMTGDGTKTYYLLKNLAAGQCGQTSQRYKIRATCISVCGGSSRTIERFADIIKDKRPRKDFVF